MARGPYQRTLRNGISQFALLALLWANPIWSGPAQGATYINKRQQAPNPIELEYAPSAGSPSTSPTPQPEAKPTAKPAPAAKKAIKDKPAQKGKATAAAPAKAISNASIRAGEHKDFGRIVFAVGAKVPFQLVPAGENSLRVNVTGGARISPQRLARIKLPQIEKMVLTEEAGKQAVLITFKPGTSWKQFRTEDGFGLDLRTSTTPPAATAAKAPEQPKPAEEPAKLAEATPPAAPMDAPVDHPTDHSVDHPAEAPAQPAAAPEKLADAHAATPTAEAAKAEPAHENANEGAHETTVPAIAAAVTPAPAPVHEVAQEAAHEAAPVTEAAHAPSPVVPSYAAATSPTPTPVPVAQSNAPAMPPSPPAGPPLISALPPPSVIPVAEVTLPGGAGIAVAQRNGMLYIAMPGKEPNDLASLVGPELAATGQATLVKTQGQGRVAAIQLPATPVFPVVSATPNGWRIAFPGQPTVTTQRLTIERQPTFTLGARLLVKSPNSSQPIAFRDPVVGDTLTLVPTSVANAGMVNSYRIPQAELLPTVQGVAIRNLADNLAIVGTTTGVEINAPGGLKLAEALPGDALPPQEGVTISNPVALDLPPLFDFDKWARFRQPNFTRERQRLNDAIVAATAQTRNVPRIDLARFYFMRGMPVEAAGLWQVVGQENPDLANRPEYHLMNAIAQLTTGNFAVAASELAAVNQPTNDAALWRGYLAAQQRKWAEAAEQFRPAIARLQDYPEPYYSRLALAATETFKKTDDDGLAREVLTMLTTRQQAELKQVTPGAEYLTGVLNANDPTKARQHFNLAANAWQQYWRVRAELALVEADLKDSKIPLEEAVRRYERLRFAWRGDALEFDIVQRLAHLHIENYKYSEAFEDYEMLTRKFPNDPRTPGLAEEKKVAFRDLFLGPPAQKVPARVQLAVWNRYPELRPEDVPQRLSMERALAERAASIDLLDQASDLLTDVLAGTTDPTERAHLGARLAGVKLLDGHFEAALAALNQTEAVGTESVPAPKLPEDLLNERRYLRAQTFSGLDQVEPALALLNNDESDTARRLKVDITWRAKRWTEAATALVPFIGAIPEDGKLTPTQQGLIVRRATALALAGDTGGLAAMRVQYAAHMDKTVDGPTFQLLTRPDGDSALADAATLGKRVAEVDMFSDFLSRYRSGDKPADAPQAN